MIEGYNLVHDATELRKLISENPDLPIVVIAGEEANSGDYCWMYCSDVSFSVEYILDVKTPYDREESVFTDKTEFEDAVSDYAADNLPSDLPDEVFDEIVKNEIAKYEPYWKKVIAIYATN